MITDLSLHHSSTVAGLPARFANGSLEEMATGLYAGPRRELVVRYTKLLEASSELPYAAPLLVGRASTGKSYAAALIARMVHQRTGRVAWINCALDLQYTDEFVSHYLPLLCRYPLVVLDDFALPQPRSFEAKQLVAIMSARYDAELPTVWTGNFATSTEEIWDQLGVMFGWAGPNIVHRLQRGSDGFRLLLA